MQALCPLYGRLTASILGHSWHNDPWYFNQKPGHVARCLELSPARHQMGHYVGIYLSHDLFPNCDIYRMTIHHFPQISILLWASNGFKIWFCRALLYPGHCLLFIPSSMQMVCVGSTCWSHGLQWTIPAWIGLYPFGPPPLPTFPWLQTSPPHCIMIPSPVLIGLIWLLMWVNMTIVPWLSRPLGWSCCTNLEPRSHSLVDFFSMGLMWLKETDIV